MEDIIMFENYSQEELDNGVDANGKVISSEERYPELYAIAQKIAVEVGDKINKEATKITSKMPYKAQFILEELIKILEKAV
jgi:hypothetical protein